ncbi:hypothetical protein [Enterococcus sp. UD-01]|jgi:hypothetical protein|uniref:hypothetical protein n=1 Tax=Enterococcus sp. UD-01 TaxID=3373911 RepID=UPI003838B357
MLWELIVLLTLFTYGSNFGLYFILRKKKKIQGIEKMSIIFGVNMTVLFLDGIFLMIGKILIDNTTVILE